MEKNLTIKEFVKQRNVNKDILKLFKATYLIKITLTDEILGSSPSDPDIYKSYIATKADDKIKVAAELEALARIIDEDNEDESEFKANPITVFHRDKDGNPILYDYQVKGFCKNAAKAYYQVDTKPLRAYKTKIDNSVFILNREIPYELPEGGEIGLCTRPLRASTPQGERVAIAKSESLPAGTSATFIIATIDPTLCDHIEKWLAYGMLNGLGQWHNSGKGRFTFEVLDADFDKSCAKRNG